MANRADILACRPAFFAATVSGGRWQCPPHLLHVAKALERVRTGECKRLMVFMPPRHGKSELVSRYFPACYLRHNPQGRVILCSYEASFAEHWGEQARDAWVEAGNLYGVGAPLRKTRGNWWITSEGGYMATAGVGGPVTGKGANIAIIDDPIKNSEEAYSETHRESVWNWYYSTLLTRLEPQGAVVLMQTRWHPSDLAGRLLKREAGLWEVISLPALAEADDPLGRTPGEALWPERYTADDLAKFRTASPRWWAAMYQQRPIIGEGSIAKREYFPVVESIPEGQRVEARSWDLAASASAKADYLVGVKMVRVGSRFYIADVSRSQIGPAEVVSKIKSVAQADGPYVKIGIEQEPGASGKITLSHVASELAGHRVEALSPRGGKVFRALGMLDQAKLGNVCLVRGSWVDAFLDEVECFGTGQGHDDQVDGAAYAFGMVAASRWVGFSLA